MKSNILVLLVVCLSVYAINAQDPPSSDVVELTDSNFDQKVGEGNIMVKFYAPWCTWCKKLAPTYEELATKLKGTVAFGKVDCTVHKPVCDRFQVAGYPTLKFFVDGGKSFHDYNQERSFESISNFVQSPPSSGAQKSLSDQNGGEVVELTHANFNDQTYDGKRWIIAFHTPWCGYCKKYLPIFESMSSKYKNAISFGKVNCETDKNICELYQIPGYPSFRFVEGNGVRDFSIEPTEQNLAYFLDKGYVDSHLHTRPWHPIVSLLHQAVVEYVWLFLGVAFFFGLAMGWIFFASPSAKSSEKQSTTVPSKETKQE